MTDDKNNIVSLLDRIKESTTEFSDEDTAWESMVDMCLQDHSDYIQALVRFNKRAAEEIEDLSRDVQDLQKTVDSLVNILIKKGTLT